MKDDITSLRMWCCVCGSLATGIYELKYYCNEHNPKAKSRWRKNYSNSKKEVKIT